MMRTGFILVFVLFYAGVAVGQDGHPYLPLAVGKGWMMKEDDGTRISILVTKKEVVAGKECFRVERVLKGEPYQTEWWSVEDGNVYVVGKLLSTNLVFEHPYLLLKNTLSVGDSWSDDVELGKAKERVTFAVESEESIATPLGKKKAFKVTLTGKVMKIARWYSRGIGLIKEVTYFREGDEYSQTTERKTVKLITAERRR